MADIFQEKLGECPLENYFSEYKGGNDYEKAVNFIRVKFFSTNSNKERSIYYHETNATDTKNIRIVWNAVHEIIVRDALKESSLI